MPKKYYRCIYILNYVSLGSDVFFWNRYSFIHVLLLQDSEMQTEPPPSAKFSATVNQWVIYDSYVDYEYQKELQDELDRKTRAVDHKVIHKRLLKQQSDDGCQELSDQIVKSARVLERMVNQNIHIDIALGTFENMLFSCMDITLL